MMPRILVDLIESEDTGVPVKSNNFKGIHHSKFSVPALAVSIA
jgi:hypothetical protein